jgi:chromosome segregation ATPase
MSELVREVGTNKIINYSANSGKQNSGQLEIPVVDQRFLTTDFRRIIKSEFDNMPSAINAEERALTLLKDYEKVLYTQPGLLGNLTRNDIADITNIAKNELFSDLANLIKENDNSIASLKNKISELQEDIKRKNDHIDGLYNEEAKYIASMKEWATELSRQGVAIDKLSDINIELQRQQDDTLDKLSNDVTNQADEFKENFSNFAKEVTTSLEQITLETDRIRKSTNLPSLNDAINKGG